VIEEMENPTRVTFFGNLSSGSEVDFEVIVDLSPDEQDQLVEQLEKNMVGPHITASATVLNIGDHLIRAEVYDYITVTFDEVDDEFEDDPVGGFTD